MTGRLDLFAPHAKVVHIDVDPSELHKLRHADIALNGRLEDVLPWLADALRVRPVPDRAAWFALLADWHSRFALGHAPAVDGGALKPQLVLQQLGRATERLDDVVWTTGVGQHQMWAMQYLVVQHPRSFITSGGLGTMGYGFPAAVGACLARPDATVICIDGDGSFQMTLHELATAVAERLAVITVILNNAHLGMVSQWQTMFYDERQSATDLRAGMPAFAQIARGFGAHGYEVHTPDELGGAFEEALTADGPSVLDVHVDPTEACFPMIAPGGAAVDQIEWHHSSL